MIGWISIISKFEIYNIAKVFTFARVKKINSFIGTIELFFCSRERVIDSFKFWQNEKGLKIFYYVIMDNHFLLIILEKNLSNIMSLIKWYTAQEIINQPKIDQKEGLINQLNYYKKK